MATHTKKPHTKKPPKKKAVAAKGAETVIREAERVPAAPAPVLVNAVKPDERLSDSPVDALVQTIEKSLEAAGQGAIAVNRKLVDIAQTNLNSGLELARDLAGAKTPMEVMRLQMNYWHDCVGVFESQARELRALSARLVATASEPIRSHMRRG
jgi:Phasin protein